MCLLITEEVIIGSRIGGNARKGCDEISLSLDVLALTKLVTNKAHLPPLATLFLWPTRAYFKLKNQPFYNSGNVGSLLYTFLNFKAINYKTSNILKFQVRKLNVATASQINNALLQDRINKTIEHGKMFEKCQPFPKSKSQDKSRTRTWKVVCKKKRQRIEFIFRRMYTI